MKMLALINRYAPEHRLRIALASSVGGLLAAVVVAVANAATAGEQRLSSVVLGVLFLIIVGIMYASQRLGARAATAAFEKVLDGLRDDFSARLIRAPLTRIEQLGPRISRATGDLAYLSSTIESWIAGVQNAVFMLGVTAIIAWISSKALLIWLVALGGGAWYMWPRARRLRDAGRDLGRSARDFGDEVERLLDGYVQIKLDGELADGVVDDVLTACDAVYDRQRTMQTIAVSTFTGTIVLVYVLGWGPAAFASADGVGLGPTLGYELVALVQLSLGPLLTLVQAVPDWSQAEAAAAGVVEVLDELGEDDLPPDGGRPPPPTFESIELSGARFRYAGDTPFGVGPIDLRLARGSLTFVTGGNGSGKTTMMKMLLGLYPLGGGAIRVDGRRQTGVDLHAYRERFTAIFSHQHLFRRLYGLADEVERERVEALLDRFGLTFVVEYLDGAFDRLDLSTGQRMRLAMIVALLEDRPICVFDEWTANQDPETTRFYYDVLLPELQAAGKTIVAVSHDDRFFDRADQLVRMADGRRVD